jgi:hypothetical protein
VADAACLNTVAGFESAFFATAAAELYTDTE